MISYSYLIVTIALSVFIFEKIDGANFSRSRAFQPFPVLMGPLGPVG